MPYRATVYRVLIASPSDLAVERRLIRQIVFGWNDLNAFDLKAVLLPIIWETHALPEMGDRAQALIKLREFKHESHRQGIVFDYDSTDELGELLARHLLATVRRLQEIDA